MGRQYAPQAITVPSVVSTQTNAPPLIEVSSGVGPWCLSSECFALLCWSRASFESKISPQRQERSGPGLGSSFVRDAGSHIWFHVSGSTGGDRPSLLSLVQVCCRCSAVAVRQEHAIWVEVRPMPMSGELSRSSSRRGRMRTSMRVGVVLFVARLFSDMTSASFIPARASHVWCRITG